MTTTEIQANFDRVITEALICYVLSQFTGNIDNDWKLYTLAYDYIEERTNHVKHLNRITTIRPLVPSSETP